MRTWYVLQRRIRAISDMWKLTFATLAWLWGLLTPYGKRRANQAIVIMLLAMFLSMGISYVLKDIINALAVGDRQSACYLLLFGVGGLLMLSQLCMQLHASIRELGWNQDYQSLFTGFSRALFSRTGKELSSEEGEVGAEQIEPAKDKSQNILYLLRFESPEVIATIITSITLMGLIDWRVSVVMLVLILFNVLWFTYFNVIIFEKMKPIERDLRRHGRRTIDKWSAALSIKTSGVEDKVIGQISDEMREPLELDKQIWAYWFQRIEFIRASINNTYTVALLVFGILGTSWNVGDFAAMFAWTMLAIDKLGMIGHIMRQLTYQVARIKAVREALMTPPAFTYNEGLIYERKG